MVACRAARLRVLHQARGDHHSQRWVTRPPCSSFGQPFPFLAWLGHDRLAAVISMDRGMAVRRICRPGLSAAPCACTQPKSHLKFKGAFADPSGHVRIGLIFAQQSYGLIHLSHDCRQRVTGPQICGFTFLHTAHTSAVDTLFQSSHLSS